MTTANNPKNQKPNGLGNLVQINENQIMKNDLLYELEAAHQIIKNALSLMSAAQKNAWARKNQCDGLIDFGATRANERETVINKATKLEG